MKRYMILFLQMIILTLLFCGESTMDFGPGEDCQLPPELIIKNISGYTVNEVYMHDYFDYIGGELLASNVPQDGEFDVPVSAGQVKYFTFIRNITSTSTLEIAITSSEPFTFNACYKYTLNLLSEDFFLQEEVNYDDNRADEPKNADTE